LVEYLPGVKLSVPKYTYPEALCSAASLPNWREEWPELGDRREKVTPSHARVVEHARGDTFVVTKAFLNVGTVPNTTVDATIWTSQRLVRNHSKARNHPISLCPRNFNRDLTTGASLGTLHY
jgi:hypothetical protein